jgi:hypothetical protein
MLNIFKSVLHISALFSAITFHHIQYIYYTTIVYGLKSISAKTSKVKYPCVMRLYILSVFNSAMFIVQCGPGSSVGIATGCGVDGPEIESQWG